MRIEIRWDVLALAGVLLASIIGSAIFSTFSLVIACIVKTRERFMGIGQVLTMPLFFASNAIYPLTLMPAWLQWVARINPLTYLVDALQRLMIGRTQNMNALIVDFGVLVLVFLILILIAGKLYPNLVQ
jgi:ABC-2 type transport system permease protein